MKTAHWRQVESTVTPLPSRLTPYALTIRDACVWSGFSRTRLESLLRARQIRAVRAGRRTLILTQSLQEFIDALPNAR